MKEINSFDGEYKFLSNFYLHPLVWEGIVYPAVENAFQAYKTLDFDEREKFQHYTPAKAKQKGRQLDLRDDWDRIKNQVMKEILLEKFKDNGLRKKLLDTYPAKLVEGNWWGDEYWGRCNGKGFNWLGLILMSVREQYLESSR